MEAWIKFMQGYFSVPEEHRWVLVLVVAGLLVVGLALLLDRDSRG